jgi:hypothetical protein
LIVFAYGLWYACGPILAPILTHLHREEHAVIYQNDWADVRPEVSWETFLNIGGDKALLTVSQNNTGSHSPTLSLIRNAQEHGILCVGIQHGHYFRPQQEVCDVACLWGPVYDPLIQAPRKVITGNPAWDGRPDIFASRQFVADHGCPEDYALFVGSLRNHYSNPAFFEQAIAQTAAHLPVIIYAHPNPEERQHDAWRTTMATRSPRVFFWPPERNYEALPDLISGARMAFGRSSCLAQAAVWDIPAMSVQDYPDMRVDNTIFFAWSGPASITHALTGCHSDTFCLKYNGGAPGEAAARVARVLQACQPRPNG